MPNFQDIISNIKAILQLIFGNNIPTWILTLIGWVLLVVLLLYAIWGLLSLLKKIKDAWTPLFYSQEKKLRSERQRRLARHIEYEVKRFSTYEDWRDDRYAELEAEVEVEGNWRILTFIPFLHRTKSGLRHEKSLSKAIISSNEKLIGERLILLEGEPGSGKSVALRHITATMAKQAAKKRSTKKLLPVYVNLKELKPGSDIPVDRNLIESFVLQCLKRINDPDFDEILQQEFKQGLQDGTWFFLFDSFDEIPEVLSSTETDGMIRKYKDAIDDFLHGISECRGVVASRHFRSPTHDWPLFRILPLSENRRLDFIRKSGLKPEKASELVGQLSNANQGIRLFANNPLFLALLCEHVKNGYRFPENAHTVFETYIKNRLIRDQARLYQRFHIDATRVRIAAERIAFCMTADYGLGLNPSRQNLHMAMIQQGMEVYDFETCLNALEFTRLARPNIAEGIEKTQQATFTFTHRRFQEYFATCVVLNEPERVSSSELLSNGRWRETTVVMCQTQPITVLTPLLKEAHQYVTQACDITPGLINNPEEYVENLPVQQHFSNNLFPWPNGIHHLLSILQDGFASRLTDVPNEIRMRISSILLTATETGMLPDQRGALAVSGIVSEPVLIYLLRKAFSSRSQWLREVAYRQTARLNIVPPDIAQSIYDALAELAGTGRLRKEFNATKAHLARIHDPVASSSLQLLLWTPQLDLVLHLALLIFIFTQLLSILIFPINILEIQLLFTLTAFCILLYIAHGALTILLNLGKYRSSSLTTRIILAAIIHAPSLFLLLHLFNFDSSNPLLEFVDILLFTYVALYGSLAFVAAQKGKFTSLRWWVLLPIWPFLNILMHPYSTFVKPSSRKTRAQQTPARKEGFVKGCVIPIFWLAIFIFICGVIPNAFQTMVNHIRILSLIFQFIGTIYNYLLEGLGFIILGAVVIWFCVYIYEWIHDILRWQIFSRKHRNTINFQDISKVGNGYYNVVLRTRVIRLLRQKHMLIPTQENENALALVAIKAEKAMHEKGQKGKTQSKRSSVAAGKSQLEAAIDNEKNSSMLFGRENLLSELNPELLDELYMLLEDVQRRRNEAEVL